MMCMDALDALLSADLSAQSSAPAELHEHVQGCRRCQTVVASLQTQTDALASVARAVPLRVTSPKRVPARAPWVAVLAAAALLVVVLVSNRPLGKHVRTEQRVLAATELASATVDSLTLVRDSAVTRQTAPVTVRELEVRITDAATAVAPLDPRRIADVGVPIETPSRVEAVPVIAVEVAIDAEAAANAAPTAETSQRKPVLLAQSNPKITVFWVY